MTNNQALTRRIQAAQQPQAPAMPEWLRRQRERAQGRRWVAVKDMTVRPQ